MFEAENNYIMDPTPERENFWLDKQQEYKVVAMQKAETRRLLQRQVSWVECERVGKLLAQLVKYNSAPSTVLAIRAPGGDILAKTSKDSANIQGLL